MLPVIQVNSIRYQYLNYMNSSYLGQVTYTWTDLTSVSTRNTIPLDSDGSYRVGILELTPAGQVLIPEPNIFILNRDYPRLDIIVPKDEKFAAPLKSHVIYFSGITDDGVLGDTVYYIEVHSEPRTTTITNSTISKTWYNAALSIPLEEEFTKSYDEISSDSKLNNSLDRVIVTTPIYPDTGPLYKYGIVAALNVLTKNIELSNNMIDTKGYNADFLIKLASRKLLLPCWREKKIQTIFSDFTDNDTLSIKKSYDLRDNSTVNEYAVGYILDNIYSKIT